MTARFTIGDHVVPKPEWIGNPNNVPTGIVRAIAPFGKDGALYVGDEKRAFAGYAFDLATADAMLPANLVAPVKPVAVAPIQPDLFEAAQ